MRIAAIILLLAVAAGAETTLNWHSDAIDGEVNVRVIPPARPTSPQPTVVYLTNLSIEPIGGQDDGPIIEELATAANLVLVLDYAHHEKATAGNLVGDVLKLRRDLAGTKDRALLADRDIDPNRLFILRQGFRLKRDIEFARDGQRVLAMDVMCPSPPARPVGVLLEISCDNVHRMGSSSLLYCHDTLLESAQFHGFAAAMVDHPVPPPYKGIDDPMPESIERMRAAVATLRAMKGELNLDGKVGAMGFSRGGPFAAVLAATGAVDAALVHGNRYDYLNLLADDPMLARFEKAWGARDANPGRWAEHGAVNYLSARSSPMFLNTSDTESPEYRHGLAQLAAALNRWGIEHQFVIDADARGHRVSTDPAILDRIFSFFRTTMSR